MRFVSGKLVILGIMTLALTAAGASWWFRYAATHRAADFWGPVTAKLIRDAPLVELLKNSRANESNQVGATATDRHDISQARGLTHLRYALLEDRSFVWPSSNEMPPGEWQWILRFRSHTPGAQATVAFFADCRMTAKVQPDTNATLVVSCEPIAAGLREVFAEMSANAGPSR